MKVASIILISTLFLAFFSCVSAAEIGQWWSELGAPPLNSTEDSPLISSYPDGLTIDWQRKTVMTAGRAAITGPMTVENRGKIKKLAENQALENLIDSIGMVRIDGFTRLSDLYSKNLTLSDDIAKLIRKTYRVVYEKVYRNENILEITVEFDLAGKGGLSGTLMPKLLAGLPSPSSSPSPSPTPSPESFTGLVIDASGLGVEGGLSPKIYSKDGREIFSLPRNTDKSALINYGVADYAPVLDSSSREAARAGENPLSVTAVSKLKSPYNCDIVISSEDADKVIKADASSNFLRRLKVVILL